VKSRRAALAVAALALALPATAAAETIVVRSDFTYPICSGFCTNWVLTVRSAGTAEFRWRLTSGRVWGGHRYRITAAEFRAFREALLPVRPEGERLPDGPCVEDDLGLSERPSWRLWWRGGGAPAHRVACSEAKDVGDAVSAGFRVLRIGRGEGLRLTPEEAAERPYF
jgi:hypothetical protein